MPAPPEKIGRYTILCELGVGGMATVYLGKSRGLGDFERLFAIKRVHPNLSESAEFVSLFLNEARIAARIHHPHVVPVYDVDIEEGRYYFSMDYVSGETLQLALQKTWNEETPFPIDVAMHAVACAAEGLHAAHELTDEDGDPLGVVHRDVTPQNILLGYDGIVRVMDFGIAKALDQVSLTQPGTWRGSVPYLAPEQVQGHGEVDRRADIFALGVVLWETVVGKRLFKHKTEIGTVARILGMDAPRPSSLREDCPQGLDEIIMMALERDPDDRFQTAQEMGDALRVALVSNGICTTSTTIQRFAERAFGERRTHRRAMERNASIHTGMIESLPKLDERPEIMSTVQPPQEPIDNPEMARMVTQITVRPVSAIDPSDDFESQPATEVSPRRPAIEKRAAPAVVAKAAVEPVVKTTIKPAVERNKAPARTPSRKPTPLPRPATQKESSGGKSNPLLIVTAALFVLLIGGALFLWPTDEPADDEPFEDEIADVAEEEEESLVAGSVGITDMAGDGGKPGTVAFYFKVKPPLATITINGEAHESDLVVPRSRTRYTIRFSAEGHHPQVVTVTAEASRLIEASLKPIAEQKKKKKRRRRRGGRRAAR